MLNILFYYKKLRLNSLFNNAIHRFLHKIKLIVKNTIRCINQW